MKKINRREFVQTCPAGMAGLSENTLVFCFGDHDRAQLWAKQWLYEGGIHVFLKRINIIVKGKYK